MSCIMSTGINNNQIPSTIIRVVNHSFFLFSLSREQDMTITHFIIFFNKNWQKP